MAIFLGSMSGTSMDGVDLAAVSITNDSIRLLHARTFAYPESLKNRLIDLSLDSNARLDDACMLDNELAEFYAHCIEQFLLDNQIDKSDVQALGSHGQTIRHSIQKPYPYTLQIGDPNIIAARTGLTVVADFRRRDIALGGQGAPLAPAFHDKVFRHNKENRCIINIGGISNITFLAADKETPVLGFDTGPGNTLIDAICRRDLNLPYDNLGILANQGTTDHSLLTSILNREPYFRLQWPKSTGTDYFSLQWLNGFDVSAIETHDLLSTLVELTVETISQSVEQISPPIDRCFVCGGGAHNRYLMERLSKRLQLPVNSTVEIGIDPDWIEAMAFAWLARQTLKGLAGNLPSVTNAQQFTVLGSIYPHNRQP